MFEPGTPAGGLFGMADHEGRDAEEAADLLHRKGPALQHLGVFGADRELDPVHAPVEQHRPPGVDRAGELLLQQLLGLFPLVDGQGVGGLQQPRRAHPVAEGVAGGAFDSLGQTKTLAAGAQGREPAQRIAAEAADVQHPVLACDDTPTLIDPLIFQSAGFEAADGDQFGRDWHAERDDPAITGPDYLGIGIAVQLQRGADELPEIQRRLVGIGAVVKDTVERMIARDRASAVPGAVDHQRKGGDRAGQQIDAGPGRRQPQHRGSIDRLAAGSGDTAQRPVKTRVGKADGARQITDGLLKKVHAARLLSQSSIVAPVSLAMAAPIAMQSATAASILLVALCLESQ